MSKVWVGCRKCRIAVYPDKDGNCPFCGIDLNPTSANDEMRKTP